MAACRAPVLAAGRSLWRPVARADTSAAKNSRAKAAINRPDGSIDLDTAKVA
ncbi:MAG: hypothetical protein U1F76_15870 [Candidatus Competibacteraceae bacterium]